MVFRFLSSGIIAEPKQKTQSVFRYNARIVCCASCCIIRAFGFRAPKKRQKATLEDAIADGFLFLCRWLYSWTQIKNACIFYYNVRTVCRNWHCIIRTFGFRAPYFRPATHRIFIITRVWVQSPISTAFYRLLLPPLTCSLKARKLASGNPTALLPSPRLAKFFLKIAICLLQVHNIPL